jgi:hypothetical protein
MYYDNMSEKPNRLNIIITEALNTSPLTRAVHDQYYIKEKAFRYATQLGSKTGVPNSDGGLAYIKTEFQNGERAVRLVLDMTNDDAVLVSSVHHEMIHVPQILQTPMEHFQEYTMLRDPNAFITQKTVWEAQAFNGQIEGPFFGFFNDLKNGRTSHIDFYKKHFSNVFVPLTRSYASALFNEDMTGMPIDKLIDHSGYLFLNRFNREDISDQVLVRTRARKKMVSDFLAKDSSGYNNQQLEFYISSAIGQYDFNRQRFNEGSYGQPMKHYIKTNFADDKTSGKKILADIINSTNTKHDIFLSNADWSEVLGTDDANLLIQNMVKTSRHITSYHNSQTEYQKSVGNTYKPI